MPSINSDLRHLTEMSDEKRRSMVESSIGPEAMRLSKQLQAMLQKEEGEIIRVETERINAVLREHEELYPPYTEDCPLCLESIPIRCPLTMVQLFCCGYGVCGDCAERSRCKCKHCGNCKGGIDTCPMCRYPIPGADKKESDKKFLKEKCEKLKKCAESGRAWAQTGMGMYHTYGGHAEFIPEDKNKARKWIESAAEQGYPQAMYELAILDSKDKEPYFEKERSLMIAAANGGCVDAQLKLAELYYKGDKGIDKDVAKAVTYFTLAYNNMKVIHAQIKPEEQRDFDCKPAYYLSKLFLGERGDDLGGLTKSPLLAKMYAEEALKIGNKNGGPSMVPVLSFYRAL